ncbi:hypothetical protein HMPREF1168_03340 [Aeromonas veronii AMC34]|uniref:Uncharacterized protein n=1 Tax=Aeromonas veronii AMC34 TaxID=1073383 RepID=K1IJH3_AERVE|nr:hypothetical protein HMPREF1168_03340 [Aeromonas veronii AMC34]
MSFCHVLVGVFFLKFIPDLSIYRVSGVNAMKR